MDKQQGMNKEMLETIKFWNIRYSVHSSFDNFLQTIEAQADLCNFSDKNRMIRDKIVLSTQGKLHAQLLKQVDLDLPKTIAICRVYEKVHLPQTSSRAFNKVIRFGNSNKIEQVQQPKSDPADNSCDKIDSEVLNVHIYQQNENKDKSGVQSTALKKTNSRLSSKNSNQIASPKTGTTSIVCKILKIPQEGSQEVLTILQPIEKKHQEGKPVILKALKKQIKTINSNPRSLKATKMVASNKNLHYDSSDDDSQIRNDVDLSSEGLGRPGSSFATDLEKGYEEYKTFKCHLCSEAFDNFGSLRAHMFSEKHQDEVPVFKDDGSLEKNNYNELNPNLDQSDEKSYRIVILASGLLNLSQSDKNIFSSVECKECKKNFPTQETYNKHQLQEHKPDYSVAPLPQWKTVIKPFGFLHEELECGETRFYSYIECPNCLKHYRARKTYNEHFGKHLGIKTAPCTVCGKILADRYQLKCHMLTHNPDAKQFECTTCGKRFFTAKSVKYHWCEKKLTCDKCNRRFSSAFYLRIHVEGKHSTNDSFLCDLCGRCYKTKSSLHKHKLQVHTYKLYFGKLKSHNRMNSIPKVSKFICRICNIEFDSNLKLKLHRASEHKKRRSMPTEKNSPSTPEDTINLCDVCGKNFTSAKNLRRHKVIHNERYTYQCEKCPKAYKCKYQLQRHKWEFHDEAKPFKCDLCNRGYASQKYLENHKCVSILRNSKRHKCDMCNKSYKDRSSLSYHKKSHTGIKPYQCVECSYSFYQKHDLLKHVSTVHRGIKPHLCFICQKAFSTKNNLANHLARHSGIKPYHCERCQKSFYEKRYINKHNCILNYSTEQTFTFVPA